MTMEAHHEAELLSAYIDGELDDADRGPLEAHLSTCASCRATLEALRATVADLAALPEPDFTEQDAWRLRAAISRARQPRRTRVAMAMGGIAAAVVTALAITVNVTGGGGEFAANEAPARQADDFGGLAADSPMTAETADGYTADSAREWFRALSLPGNEEEAATLLAERSAETDTADTLPPPAAQDEALRSRDVARCDATIRASGAASGALIVTEPVTYDSAPAIFLVYLTTDERDRRIYRFFVARTSDCQILLVDERRA